MRRALNATNEIMGYINWSKNLYHAFTSTFYYHYQFFAFRADFQVICMWKDWILGSVYVW